MKKYIFTGMLLAAHLTYSCYDGPVELRQAKENKLLLNYNDIEHTNNFLIFLGNSSSTGQSLQAIREQLLTQLEELADEKQAYLALPDSSYTIKKALSTYLAIHMPDKFASYKNYLQMLNISLPEPAEDEETVIFEYNANDDIDSKIDVDFDVDEA